MSARTNAKKREQKERQVRRVKENGIEAQRAKPPPPTRATGASMKNKTEKRRKNKKNETGIKAQRAKPNTPTRATDALIDDEEQNGRQRKEEKERNRKRDSN